MSEHPKSVRKQMRTVVKELFEETMSAEMEARITAEVTKRVDARMAAIAESVNGALKEIDSRAQAIQSFVLRNTK